MLTAVLLSGSSWAQERDAGVKPEKVAPPPEAEAPSEPWFHFSDLLPITPALTSMHYDLSAVYASHNFGFAEGGMRATGLRFTERNSGLGKMTVYVVTQLFLAFGEAAAASGAVQKHVGTEYRPGYRIDYYQRFSADEVASMRAAREQAGEDVLSSNMSLDLQLYLPLPGRSTSSGISVELTPLTVQFTDSGQIGLELAFAYTKMTDIVNGDPTRLRAYENLGMPLRLMANWQFVSAVLQWAPNFFGGFGVNPGVMQKNYEKGLQPEAKTIFYNNSPLSLALSLHPLRNVFVRGTGYWSQYRFDVSTLGFQLEAGLRL